MNKDIKDYLRLHLGCEAKSSKGTMVYRLSSVDLKGRAMFYDGYGNDMWLGEDFKLILRPLSDMTQVEAQTIFSRYFEKDFAYDYTNDTGSANFIPKRVIPSIKDAIRIINGKDYETGDFMKVVSIVPYLLSKHFDLFGLIESGLAIDKTKLNY